MTPRWTVRVLRDGQVGASHDEREIVRLAHRRDGTALRGRARPLGPVRRAHGGVDPRAAPGFDGEPAGAEGLPPYVGPRPAVLGEAPRRERREDHRGLAAVEDAEERGGGADDAGQLLEAARDVDHGLRPHHRHRALIRAVAQLDVERRPRRVLALRDAEAVARRLVRRRARPMVALAVQPGPRAPQPALTPSCRAAGPLTMRSGATLSSVVCTPRRLNAGSRMACTAASTTGKCSGRQPAITALAAIFSTLATPPSGSISPRTA